MAIAYKSGAMAMVTGGSTAYTCPANTSAIVLLLQVANIDGTNSADATVTWEDASNSATDYNLIKAIPVAAKTSISALAGTGKLILNAGDEIEAVASANGDLELTYSLIEIS